MRWALPLLFPALVVAPASERFADALAARMGQALATAGAALPSRAPAELEIPADQASEQVASEPPASSPLTAPPQGRARGAKASAPPKASTEPLRVMVSARQVLALAEGPALPRGVPVARGANHPAGLRLSGVARLGVGLREGDVLTHVEGRPVTAASQVVEAVLRARARKATVISGVFYRNSRRGVLVVEQPYTADPPGRP